jgi:hypothetical protein
MQKRFISYKLTRNAKLTECVALSADQSDYSLNKAGRYQIALLNTLHRGHEPTGDRKENLRFSQQWL